jgi:pantoate--beta-alanine ligase
MHLFMKIVSLQLIYPKPMCIFYTQTELVSYLNSISNQKTTIGFVPTMGALHDGHLSLMKEALDNNSIVVVSIFVNPTQFNNADDLAKYPRTLDEDVKKIHELSDNIIVFAPTVDDIYKGNTISQHFDFDGLENQMEGKFRPGHFDGVGTIVKRLFEIVNPSNAYFGEKDFQQLQVIKKMVAKLQIPVTIIGCPILRESNGLAMSSRNERLTTEQRKQAIIIFQTLLKTKEYFQIKTIKEVHDFVVKTFNQQNAFELEYFQIADEATLVPCYRKNKTKKYRAFIAVFVNNIRLIDTISLN